MLRTKDIKPTKILHAGFSIGQFKMPDLYVQNLNIDFDNLLQKKAVNSWNANLAGQIKKEWEVTPYLNKACLEFFASCAKSYVDGTCYRGKRFGYRIEMNSCWFNDQIQHEYNPAHVHYGDTPVGISSVLFLKVPEAITKATSINKNEAPKDGRLEFLAASENPFCQNSYVLTPEPGDLYIFPYDLPHTVYPFKGEGVRRSLSFNADVIIGQGNG